MYNALLWPDFIRLNHIKGLSLTEQKREYDRYNQLLLHEYMTHQLQMQMQQAAPGGGGGGGSTPGVPISFSSAFSNAFN